MKKEAYVPTEAELEEMRQWIINHAKDKDHNYIWSYIIYKDDECMEALNITATEYISNHWEGLIYLRKIIMYYAKHGVRLTSMHYVPDGYIHRDDAVPLVLDKLALILNSDIII